MKEPKLKKPKMSKSKRNKILIAVFGLVGTILLITGITIPVVNHILATKKNEKDSVNTLQSKVFDVNREFIYSISVPLKFIINYKMYSVFSQQGTAWVFDKKIENDPGYDTYYLLTNLHVVDFWNYQNINKGADREDDVKVRLLLPKSTYDPDSPRYELNKENLNKNLYIWNNSISANEWLKDWTMPFNNLLWYPKSIDNKTINSPISLPFNNSFPINNATFNIYPFGIHKTNVIDNESYIGYDMAIIEMSFYYDSTIKTIVKPNFIKVFDSIVRKKHQVLYNKPIYDDLSLKITSGGFFVSSSTSNNPDRVIWNSFDNYNQQANYPPNSKRANITYNGLLFENKAKEINIYNFNIGPGCSGSAVIKNETFQSVGIYWGGYKNDQLNFFNGSFLPFYENNFLELWHTYYSEIVNPLKWRLEPLYTYN